MLKSRDSYSEIANYDLFLGNHVCDVYLFGLSAVNHSQVKLLLGNKNTSKIRFVSRMLIMLNTGTHVLDFYHAKELVNFLELVKDDRVNKLTGPCGLVYDKTYERNLYTIKIDKSGHNDVLFNSRTLGAGSDVSPKDLFYMLVDRLLEITKEFIKVVDSRLEKPDPITGKRYTHIPVLESYFKSGCTTMIPLNHKYEGPFKNIYVSVYNSTTSSPHVAISNGDKKLMLFPFINNPGSASLKDIVEGVIHELLSLETEFNLTLNKGDFHNARKLELSDDRITFMESISTRPNVTPFGEETIDTFYFILNSNAVLGAPMTYFRYEPKFLEDLVSALRFAISDKFIK